jgi:hypothetical protein
MVVLGCGPAARNSLAYLDPASYYRSIIETEKTPWEKVSQIVRERLPVGVCKFVLTKRRTVVCGDR